MEALATAFVVTAVAGATEFIKRLYDRDYRAAVIIATSAIIGLAAGLLHAYGLDAFTGLVMGLSASGLVTIAAKVNTAAVVK